MEFENVMLSSFECAKQRVVSRKKMSGQFYFFKLTFLNAGFRNKTYHLFRNNYTNIRPLDLIACHVENIIRI